MAPSKPVSQMDFSSMLGGPLTAVIEAQSQASMATLQFVKTVGFDGNRPQTVPFQLRRTIAGPDGAPIEELAEVALPTLSLVPVPCVRVSEAEIEFRARIISAEAVERDGERGDDKAPATLRLRTTFAQRKRIGGDEHNRSYSMRVRMRAVQDHLPPGLEQLISMLESQTTGPL